MTTTYEPEISMDGFFFDFCYWSQSLNAVKERRVPPSAVTTPTRWPQLGGRTSLSPDPPLDWGGRRRGCFG